VSSTGTPTVGALVRDAKRDRVGIYMGRGGPFAMLRPLGGGQEWEARPEDLRQEVSAVARPVDVAQLHAAYDDHVKDCATCTREEACDIGRALWLTCEEAARVAEPIPQRSVSGVLAITRGQPVPPCPFPCSICRAEGHQSRHQPSRPHW
jgi:hypothetical protein